MTRLIEIDHDPSPRQLVWFGLLFCGFCVLAGSMVRWRMDATDTATVIWFIGGALAVLYWVVPPWRRWIYLGWLYAVFPVGWVVSHAMLAAVYFLVITPIGFAKRLITGDALHRTPDLAASSYWSPRGQQHRLQRYFRQY